MKDVCVVSSFTAASTTEVWQEQPDGTTYSMSSSFDAIQVLGPALKMESRTVHAKAHH